MLKQKQQGRNQLLKTDLMEYKVHGKQPTRGLKSINVEV